MLATVRKMQARARSLLVEWRALLLGDVAGSRRLLRTLLGTSRFRFYQKGRGALRFYDVGVLPTLDGFIDALPDAGKIAMASPAGTRDTYEPGTRETYELPLGGTVRKAA